MDKKYHDKIVFEINQIDELLSASEPLLKLVKQKEPDFMECSAMALTLHSFYNGIENILLTISKSTGNSLKNDHKWHKSLLEYTFENHILDESLRIPMNEYLTFRHFVRHSYGFQIEWDQLEPLSVIFETIWLDLKKQIQIYLIN